MKDKYMYFESTITLEKIKDIGLRDRLILEAVKQEQYIDIDDVKDNNFKDIEIEIILHGYMCPAEPDVGISSPYVDDFNVGIKPKDENDLDNTYWFGDKIDNKLSRYLESTWEEFYLKWEHEEWENYYTHF